MSPSARTGRGRQRDRWCCGLGGDRDRRFRTTLRCGLTSTSCQATSKTEQEATRTLSHLQAVPGRPWLPPLPPATTPVVGDGCVHRQIPTLNEGWPRILEPSLPGLSPLSLRQSLAGPPDLSEIHMLSPHADFCSNQLSSRGSGSGRLRSEITLLSTRQPAVLPQRFRSLVRSRPSSSLAESR